MARADRHEALYLRHWRCETDLAMGTLLCVHGLSEHSGRYIPLAAAACRAGLDVLAVDLFGHGRSPGPRGHIRNFTVDHLGSVDALMAGADEAGLQAPRFLFGHSLGGLIAARWAQVHIAEGRLAGLILMTPYIAPQIRIPRWKRLLAVALSGPLPGFTLPTGIRDADLFRDPAEAAAFASDPLVQRRISAGHWVALVLEQQRLMARAEEIRIPTLLQLAAEDRIASSDAARALGRALPDATIVEYAKAFHPLHRDPVSGQVFEDLIDWVRQQAA
ncbi:MAG: alpha/beta fold hydrolase [Gemmatimonadales bacterium]|nr:MAG: alpha/beta fold hydrolase [Gemmatimonadales bacterium]